MDEVWVESSQNGWVRTLTLGAPEGPHRMNEVSTAELWAAVESAVQDPATRVLVLAGGETAWNVGGDLARMRAAGPDVGDVIHAIGRPLTPLVEALHGSELVTIAAVRGAVAGGGLGLLCAMDLVVAADDAVFTQGYARLGASPDAGTTWFLPRIVGYRKAFELYLSSARLSAREALGLGLVSRVVPPDEVETAAAALAQRVAALEPDALVTTKRLFRTSFDVPLTERLEAEIAQFTLTSTTAPFREGLSAFFDRRDALFS